MELLANGSTNLGVTFLFKMRLVSIFQPCGSYYCHLICNLYTETPIFNGH